MDSTKWTGQHNKQRVRKLELAYRITQNHYNKKAISIQAKIRHYNTVIKPEATHGSKCLTVNKKELRELEKYRNITDTVRRRRLKFYGHLKRMNENRLTKKIFNYIAKLKCTTGRMVETRKDVVKVGITEELFNNRENMRRLIDSARFPEDRPKPRPEIVWAEEQRRAVGEEMRRLWEGGKEEDEPEEGAFPFLSAWAGRALALSLSLSLSLSLYIYIIYIHTHTHTHTYIHVSGFSHAGIVPDDAAGRRVFSGISRFPRPFVPALHHNHLVPPSSALKTSMIRAVQISSLARRPVIGRALCGGLLPRLMSDIAVTSGHRMGAVNRGGVAISRLACEGARRQTLEARDAPPIVAMWLRRDVSGRASSQLPPPPPRTTSVGGFTVRGISLLLHAYPATVRRAVFHAVERTSVNDGAIAGLGCESIVQRRNDRAGETETIVRHDSHVRKSACSDLAGIEPGLPWWEASRLTAQPPRPRGSFALVFIDYVLISTILLNSTLASYQTRQLASNEFAALSYPHKARASGIQNMCTVEMANGTTARRQQMATPLATIRKYCDESCQSCAMNLQQAAFLLAALNLAADSSPVKREHCTPVGSLARSGDSAVYIDSRLLSTFYEALLKIYFQDIPPPRIKGQRTAFLRTRFAKKLRIYYRCRGSFYRSRVSLSQTRGIELMQEPCRTMPLVGGFPRGSPVSPALEFQRCLVPTSRLKIWVLRAAHISSLTHTC
ncbi:hypothetical protein PR048_029528 [Dryococelus australis]|uniref:Uncharacterized protein n=1 Tax=Dryococelus australis TaxID=614101 RepID=A0ABQ9GDM1_9NEOP|nr:hypothetical protein PR048_029528 [Dryococelus australis]